MQNLSCCVMTYTLIAVSASVPHPLLLQSVLDDLKNLLSRNGYSRGIIIYNINDVVTRSRNKSKDAVTTVSKRDVFIVLPYLGFHSKVITQQLKS